MMSYKVTLPIFEGPFDLLVYLIENAKMSIYDIQVSKITEQYLGYIDKMKELDVNVASEFMVLAATLIDIKSRMILPRHVDNDGAVIDEDPRRELTLRILEYKRFKEASEMLAERAEAGALIYEKPQEDISEFTESPDEYLALSLDKFVSAFKLFLEREKRVADVKAHYQRVERDKVSTESRISLIKKKVKEMIRTGIKRMSFGALIQNKKDRYDVIVTFTAVLQMIKDRQLDACQKAVYGEIAIIPPKKGEKDVQQKSS